MKSPREQDLENEFFYTRREWIVQRIGWLCMFLFIVAASFGFFGGGGISSRVAEGPATALKVSYERFARYASTSMIEFTVGESHGQHEVVIEGDENYFQAFEITSIAPTPLAVASVGGRLQFKFSVARLPTTITVRLKAQQIGSHVGVFQLQGSSPVEIEQFIYP